MQTVLLKIIDHNVLVHQVRNFKLNLSSLINVGKIIKFHVDFLGDGFSRCYTECTRHDECSQNLVLLISNFILLMIVMFFNFLLFISGMCQV